MSGPTDTFKYQKCFVAFLDILGFKKKIIESQDRSDKIKILVDSLRLCGGFPSGGKKVIENSVQKRVIDIRSRFFSDTLVFFLKKKPKDISHLFFIIRYLQDRLWKKGVCLRGAVTVDYMYWPSKSEDKISLGPGLLNAYRLESDLAIFPRILVSKSLLDYIDSNKCSADPFGTTGELKDFIRRDNDGVYFLDLLNQRIRRAKGEKCVPKGSSFSIQYNPDAENTHAEILKKIGTLIKKNIASKEDKIRQKYEWLRSYKETRQHSMN